MQRTSKERIARTGCLNGIEMAKKLLVENDTSISQIANACGYNSLAYFSKCFKEATGMTPKEYVKSVL
jgi:AraC-like DNA-binding protein